MVMKKFRQSKSKKMTSRAHSNKVKKTRQKCVKHLPTPPKRSIIVFLHNYLALLFSSSSSFWETPSIFLIYQSNVARRRKYLHTRAIFVYDIWFFFSTLNQGLIQRIFFRIKATK